MFRSITYSWRAVGTSYETLVDLKNESWLDFPSDCTTFLSHSEALVSLVSLVEPVWCRLETCLSLPGTWPGKLPVLTWLKTWLWGLETYLQSYYLFPTLPVNLLYIVEMFHVTFWLSRTREKILSFWLHEVLHSKYWSGCQSIKRTCCEGWGNSFCLLESNQT